MITKKMIVRAAKESLLLMLFIPTFFAVMAGVVWLLAGAANFIEHANGIIQLIALFFVMMVCSLLAQIEFRR